MDSKISKKTVSKRVRRSKDSNFRQMETAMSIPSDDDTPRTLIKNIVKAGDFWSSFEAKGIPLKQSRKSKTPNVASPTRSASKIPKVARLTRSAAKSPKVASPAKSPKVASPAKSPKVASPAKSPKVASPAKSPKVASPAKSPKVTSPAKSPKVASQAKSASKTPNVSSLARPASKTPGAKLTNSERNDSDTFDSFVLPTYRTNRRQIGKKQRKKPTKADVEAFAAGAEAILAAREFLSTSESETETSFANSAARHVSASENALQDSYAADSFVLRPYNAGRRILKKKRRVPGPHEARAFAKAVDEIKEGDNQWMTTDESSTDSHAENPKRLSRDVSNMIVNSQKRHSTSMSQTKTTPQSSEDENLMKTGNSNVARYSSTSKQPSKRDSSTDSHAENPKRLSRDVSNMIVNSQKRHSTSMSQTKETPQSSEDDKFVKTGNSNAASSISKQPSKRDSSRFYVSDALTEENSSGNIVTTPILSGASSSQRITRSGSKKANMTPQDAVTLLKKRSMQFNSMKIASPNDSEIHGFSPKLSSTRINQRHSSSFKDKISAPSASRTNQLSQKILETSSTSKKSPIRSPQKNKSTDSRQVSLLTFHPRSSPFQEDFYSWPASNVKKSAKKLTIQESDSEKIPASTDKLNLRSRTAETSTRFTQSKFEDDEAGESLIKERSLRSKLKVDSASSKNISNRSLQTREMVLPPGTSEISPEQFSPTNRSTGPRHDMYLPESPMHSLAVQDTAHNRPALRLSESSEQSDTDENEFAQDPVFSAVSLRSSRTINQLTSVQDQVEVVPPSASQVSSKQFLPLNRSTGSQRALFLPESPKRQSPKPASRDIPLESPMEKSKSFRGVSLSSGRKTLHSSTGIDLNKSSGRKSMMQSRLVFSPKSSGKLRFSNQKTSRLTGSQIEGSAIEARENESLGSARRKSKNKLKRQRDSAFLEDFDSGSENDKSNPFWNAAKPSTSRKNDSDEDPETRFRNRKGPVSPPSDSESDSTIDINKSTKTLPKTKKTAKNGQTSKKAQPKDEFVPLSGTKANFEHFLQKRIMRPTAMEVQKQANRFFRMTRDEMEKMMAKKPNAKKYIAPTEIKNMFVKQGLFESLDHLEMNARQWLDTDGQDMVIDYQEAFRNIKYD